MVLFSIGTSFSSFVQSLICMWRGNFDTSTWFLILRFSHPLDVSKIYAWYLVLLVSALYAFVNTFSTTIVLTYIIGCSIYIEACCDHFDLLCREIDEQIRSDHETMVEMNKEIVELTKSLNNIVSFHVKILESVTFCKIFFSEICI